MWALSPTQEPYQLLGHLGSMWAIRHWYRHTVRYVGTKASQRLAKPEASLDLPGLPDEA